MYIYYIIIYPCGADFSVLSPFSLLAALFGLVDSQKWKGYNNFSVHLVFVN